MSSVKSILFIIYILLGQASVAAPHPTTGSSSVNNLKNNLLFSQMGFQILRPIGAWKLTGIPSKNESPQIDFVMNKTARLSFTLDTLKTNTQVALGKQKIDLESYVKKYLRDYNQYGFEVDGIQSYKVQEFPSIIVDLQQKNKKTRSRQVFFQKNNKVVTATCVDEFETYEQTLVECNKILGGFFWK